jgi:hypothetical protein
MSKILDYEKEHIEIMVNAFVKQKESWEKVCSELLKELAIKSDVTVEQLEKIRSCYPDEVSNIDFVFVDDAFSPEEHHLFLPEMTFSSAFIVIVQMMIKRNKIRSEFKIGLLEQIDVFLDGKSEHDKPLSFRQINALQQWKPLTIRDLL